MNPTHSRFAYGTRQYYALRLALIFIGLLIVVAFCVIVNASAADSPSDDPAACGSAYGPSTRYVSHWIEIPAGSTRAFKHGFKCGPLELNVWAKITGTQNVRPYTDYKGNLSVISANHDNISVENFSDTSYTVQVVARP